MPIAYSYIRFSTAEQKKGDSLRRQTELSKNYADQHGLTLDSSLHMHDLGISAYDRSNLNRGALGVFLEAVNQGRIIPGSFLLVESLDRLSRAQVMEALQVFISILNQGITIVTLGDGMEYNTKSVGSNFGNLVISIMIMARAHEESATKSHRLKAAWNNKRTNIGKKKLTGQCPRWMTLSEDKTEFRLIPDRVDLIMEILTLVKNGMGQAQIAKRLNERSVPPFSNHGTGWHSSYIQKIVTSSALYGELQPHVWENGKIVVHGEPVPDYYPALITKEEFFLLQSLRSQRKMGSAKGKKGTGVPNLLSGVVKCGYCGSTMILAGGAAKRIRSDDGSIAKRPSKKVLVCDGGRRGLGCYAVQWGYKDFERSFLTFCRDLDFERILDTSSQSKNAHESRLTVSEQLRATDAAIEEKKKRLTHLVDALELGEEPKQVIKRIHEHEVDLQKLDDLKMKLETELHTVESLNAHHTFQAKSIRESVDKLESLSGDSLFTVRVSLSEHIRNLIEVVQVFPAGRLTTVEEIEYLKTSLLESGFPKEQIDDYVSETMRSQPKRTGRGIRGRYVSRKDVGRHFLIKAKNGGYRIVYPDFEDPSAVIVEMEMRGKISNAEANIGLGRP